MNILSFVSKKNVILIYTYAHKHHEQNLNIMPVVRYIQGIKIHFCYYKNYLLNKFLIEMYTLLITSILNFFSII